MTLKEKIEMVANQLIKQEQQLLEKTDSLDVLADLIDDEFLEIGSSATIFDKAEIIRWLRSEDKSDRAATSFKVKQLSEDLILLTYISIIKEKPYSKVKKAIRASIWRLKNKRWRMIFHQGTPLQEHKDP